MQVAAKLRAYLLIPVVGLLFFAAILFQNGVVSAAPVPIPAGCPNSPDPGPLAPGFTCPTPAPGCAGSNVNGPPAPGIDCADISTWPGYVAAGDEPDPNETVCPGETAGQPVDPSTRNEDGRCKVPVDCSPEDADAELNETNCKILSRLLDFINLLSGLVGVSVVLIIIYGGIQYSTAGSDPNKVAAAKKRIFNALFALFAFIFMYSFLQWVIPGGVF